MKKIIAIAIISLCIVSQLAAQIEGNPRYLKVEQTNDISKINIEQGISYFIKTETDGDYLKVVVYKNQEIIATYPADAKIYPIYQNKAALAANSTLVDRNANLKLLVAEDSLLIFDSNLQKFQTGEILVGGISHEAPDGYLRKVVSQEIVDEHLIVHTMPVGLDEAFDEISINEIVDFSEIIDAQSILENNPRLKSDEGTDYDFGKGSINLSFSKKINDFLTISMAFKGNIKLEFQYEKRSGMLPEKAKLVSYLYVENATSTTIGGKINIMDWELGEINLPEVRFAVPIGGVPVPIILKNKLLFKIDASVDVGTKVTGGIFGSVQAKAGVEYNNGTKSPISGLEKNFDVDGPYSLEPSFKGGISGKVELQTLPYGIDIVMGYASVSWGPQIIIQPDHPQWKITSQWKLKAGFKTKFLGISGDLNTGYDFPEHLIGKGSFVTGLPTLFSYPAEDVTKNSAKLVGHVREDNGSAVTERGFYWGNSLGRMNNKVMAGSGIGEYNQTITGLRNGETYYYRTYAINAKGTTYGELMNFIICEGLPYRLYPHVNETWNVTDNSAEVSGNISVSGLRMATADEYGFVWTTSYFSPQTNINTYAHKVSVTPVEPILPFGANIQATITGLLPNTQYTIIAYAKSGGETFYGGYKKIKTLDSANSAVTFNISDATNVSYTSATFNVTVAGNVTVTDKGICYDWDSNTPTPEDSKISKGTGTGSFSITMNDLWENWWYYVRPYAIVDGKTYFGEMKKFLASNESQVVNLLCDNPIETGKTGARKEISYTFCENGIMAISGKGLMSGSFHMVSHWYDSWFKDSVLCLIINEGFTNIGYFSFQTFKNLKTVLMPTTISSIGNNAFARCYKLESINIPSGVTTIEYGAFAECSSLTQLSLPTSLISIESRAFYECYKLESINLPNGITDIKDWTFGYCSSLSSIMISNTVTSIGIEAFWNCTSLTSITLPKSLKSIEKNAFGNAGLTSIEIPQNVTDIKDGAFYHCINLKSIIISNSVTNIEDNAFSYCKGLEEVTVKWMQPLTVSDPFGEKATPLSSVILKVPAGTKGLYEKAEGWKNFGQIVEYTP
jgi:hypothetical protein